MRTSLDGPQLPRLRIFEDAAGAMNASLLMSAAR